MNAAILTGDVSNTRDIVIGILISIVIVVLFAVAGVTLLTTLNNHKTSMKQQRLKVGGYRICRSVKSR